MSGGSFDYLCYKDADELVAHVSAIRDMASELTNLGYDDAAAETEDVIAFIRHALRQIESRRKRLEDVWQAVEWHASGDSGRDRIEKAIAEYREPQP